MFDGFFNGKFREVFEKRFPGKDVPFHTYYDMSTGDFTGTRNKNVFSVYFQFSARINSALKKMYGNWNNRLWYGSSFDDKLNRIPVVIERIEDEEFLNFLRSYSSSVYNTVMILMEGIQFGSWKEPEWYNEKCNECDLLHVLKVFDYTNEDIKKVIDYTRTDHSKDFPEDLMKNGKFKENRLWIPLSDGSYFVLSKNVWDSVWASTGNDYCSCYNLDSPTGYITGSPYLMTQSWYFMAYISNGTSRKYSMFQGKKFRLPQISGRCWSYKTENGMVGDKVYGEAVELIAILNRDKGRIVTDLFDDNIYSSLRRYATYADSLKQIDGTYYYSFGNGELGHGHWLRSTPLRIASDITYNASLSVDVIDNIELLNGKYGVYKRCPVTGMLINQNEDRHWSAKYMDKPVQHLLIFTYSVDDKTLLGATNKHCTLEGAKEVAKEYSNDYYGETDAVLLKIIDGNRMTFQPFYRKGE